MATCAANAREEKRPARTCREAGSGGGKGRANELFGDDRDEAAAIRAQGFDFYDWAPGEVRLVTSWDQDMAAVDRLAGAIAALDSPTG